MLRVYPVAAANVIGDQVGAWYQQQRYECCEQDSITERYCHRDHKTCLARGLEVGMIITATGVLHDAKLMSWKSSRELSAENSQNLSGVNTILPALVAKYFLPKLNRDNRSSFAALSTRVASISDSQFGGSYANRASKYAPNYSYQERGH